MEKNGSEQNAPPMSANPSSPAPVAALIFSIEALMMKQNRGRSTLRPKMS